MSRRRRIVFYSFLFLLAGGLLAWQWWQGKPLRFALGRVNDPDAAVRARAATELGEYGLDSDQAWNELGTMALHDSEDDTRDAAVSALKFLWHSNAYHDESKRRERKRRLFQTLLDGFNSGNVEVRRRVPEVVYEIAGLEYHERAVKRAADDAVDRDVRPVAVTALIRALKDPDEEVREEAVYCLGKLATVPVEAEPALLDNLRSKDAVMRGGAALALSKLPRISADAIPGLIVAAQDDSREVRLTAFHCLLRIGPQVVPPLREALAKAPAKSREYLEICLKAFDGAKKG